MTTAHISDVLRIQLTNWRWSWPSMVLTGMITPIMTLLALGTVAADSHGSNSHILAGAVTIALLFETQNKVASNFAFMKSAGSFDFFSSLPMRREGLILGTLGAFLLLAMPAVVVTTFIGWIFLDIDANIRAQFLLPIILAVTAFAGVGAVVGSVCSSVEQTSSISLAVTVLLTSLGPVIISPAQLPNWLVSVGRFNPATMASDSIRGLLIGQSNYGFVWDVGGLVLFSVVVWIVVQRIMPWRGRAS